MKLTNDLFEILKSSENETGFMVTIRLNPDHIIYKGHFPGHPVTPAVIQLQIIHELIEKKLGKKLKLISISHSKFLKIIDPIQIPELVIRFEFTKNNDELKVKTYGENVSDVYFRIDSIYQFI